MRRETAELRLAVAMLLGYVLQHTASNQIKTNIKAGAFNRPNGGLFIRSLRNEPALSRNARHAKTDDVMKSLLHGTVEPID